MAAKKKQIRKPELYVSFEDSRVDPTYSGANGVVLVLSNKNPDNGNPVVGKKAVKTPLIPDSFDDLVRFCAFMGWTYDHDSEGQVVLYTGITNPEKVQ